MDEQPAVEQPRKERSVRRVLSNLLFVAALVIGTQPWWTGAYTYLQQRAMAAKFDSASPRLEQTTGGSEKGRNRDSKPKPDDDPLYGWQSEDLAYWEDLPEGGTMGRLELPAGDVNALVVKGVSKADLKLGPGWIPETSLPGETGNFVISGHRTTYLAPFRNLQKVKRDDIITFRSPYREYTYLVTAVIITRPDNMKLLEDHGQPEITLTACHPPYSAKQRIVVQGLLVNISRRSSS